MRYGSNGELIVLDDFQSGEILSDQVGSGGVLFFSFDRPVNMVQIFADGINQVARADPFGGTPTATFGIPCPDEVPVVLQVKTSVVRVFAPSSMRVTIWGFRRAPNQ